MIGPIRDELQMEKRGKIAGAGRWSAVEEEVMNKAGFIGLA